MSVDSLDQALQGVERVLLDASTLLAFHGQHEATHSLAKRILGRIEDTLDPLRGYYSVVSATELLVRPLRAGPTETAYMHAFLRSFPNLSLLPVDLDVASQAATLRAIKNLKTPDALIVAEAMNPSEKFGDLLRRYRAAAGLTQEELAERAETKAAGHGKINYSLLCLTSAQEYTEVDSERGDCDHAIRWWRQ